ncbi:lipocalin family protein [Aliiroseovarius sp. S1339]|uniref:lipocalin family protein n=1 Tax=Aliiroseovarius sp. S1339 TaxID=2936990 RepID=UPI0020C0754E|nr:lipocalin family protein [Aliiroseovarius sp. S1339]MCK8463876.1 lipocalin family protein [Aliiroseovarius sp. S1339]
MDRRQMLMTAAALTASAGLTACVGGGGSGVEFHRSKTRQLSSTTRFNAARFAGRWVIRGEFVYPGDKPSFGAVNFAENGGAITALDVYGPSGLLDHYSTKQPAPGRISVGSAPFDTQYWVLWVDADYRTAAIGTPSGSFGWIIDRSNSGGEDRIKAARDVLGFNGYNLSRLKTR